MLSGEKLEIVFGNKSSEEAKIAGITPEILTFIGKYDDCPPKTLLPTCLLGYWTKSLLCPLSMKTITTNQS